MLKAVEVWISLSAAGKSLSILSGQTELLAVICTDMELCGESIRRFLFIFVVDAGRPQC